VRFTHQNIALEWTRDVSKAHRLAKAIRAGSVWVNCYQAMDPAVPFGGYKMSGYGRESGLQQLEEYLNVKAVWIKTARRFGSAGSKSLA
jgi:aldehyde dehydrogenase (NAD+)